MMKFTYDRRRRLTHEVRQTYDGSPAYDFAYEYDAGGNRTKKIDAVAQTETRYHYDVDADANPPEGNVYGSFNNRLQWYEVYSTAGAMPRLSRTWYFYYYGPDGKSSGNVERIVAKSDASSHYTATFFKYGKNNRTVNYIVGEQWEWNGTDACVPNATYERTYAWEFRYDSARQRYAGRQLNPATLRPYQNLAFTWTDYDGNTAYGDRNVTDHGLAGFSYSEARSFEPGIGRFEWSGGQPNWLTEAYYHGDLLGTVRGISQRFHSPAWQEPMAFTAFGERITGTQNTNLTRYGYVGAYGYQAHADMPYLHVGHRYYDPASGRFLQRDPIGIRGGSNVYAYARNLSTILVDPSGLLTSIGNPKAIPVLIEVGALLGMDLVASTNVGLSIGVTAMACSSIWQRTPAHGRPNGSEAFDDGNGKGTIRDYGPDGRAIRDYDFGHDHGAGDPHTHDWDWSQIPPRQPGRPLLPGE